MEPQKIQMLLKHLDRKIANALHHSPPPPNKEGYNKCLQYLHNRYGDVNKIKLELWHQIQNYPSAQAHVNSVHNTVDKLDSLIQRYRQIAPTIDEEMLFTLIIQKITPRCYQSTLVSKEHHVKNLFTATREWVEVQELNYSAEYHNAKPNNQNSNNRNKGQKFFNKNTRDQTAEAVPVYANTPNQKPRDGKPPQKGKGRGRGQKKNSSTSENNNSSPSTSRTNAPFRPPSNPTGNSASFTDGAPLGFIRMKRVPRAPCTFCAGAHHPFLCTAVPTKEGRLQLLNQRHICIMYLQPHD
ncbi:hypothetical protein V9T40_009045 [Parthenolecanium corni]|uniref:Gag protein n=1 Tax=Parthenolecanium corni TaxID=536013 RepID=A0AAN9TZ14_9HEMI